MSVDTIDDLAFLGLGVWGDGETWAYGGMNGFGSRCAGRSSDDWFGMGRIGRGRDRVHECNGGGTEFCSGGNNFDVAAEDVDGSRHVVVGK